MEPPEAQSLRDTPLDLWPQPAAAAFYAKIGLVPRHAPQPLIQRRLDYLAYLYVTGRLADDAPD